MCGYRQKFKRCNTLSRLNLVLTCLFAFTFIPGTALAQGIPGEDYFIDSILFEDNYWPDNDGTPVPPHILSGGPVTNSRSGNEGTELVRAVMQGDMQAVEAAMRQSHEAANIALCIASEQNLGRMVQSLVQSGVDVNAVIDTDAAERHDLPCRSALGCAASNGAVKLMTYLITQGADVNLTDKSGWTPLHHAAHRKHPEAILKLLQNGSSVTAKTEYGYTALHLAAASRNAALAEMLLRAGADPNATEAKGYTPLHYACGWRNLHTARTLILYGAQVNAMGENQIRPEDVIGEFWLTGDEATERSLRSLLAHYGKNGIPSHVVDFVRRKQGQVDPKLIPALAPAASRARPMRSAVMAAPPAAVRQTPRRADIGEATRQRIESSTQDFGGRIPWEGYQSNKQPSRRTYSREVIPYKK